MGKHTTLVTILAFLFYPDAMYERMHQEAAGLRNLKQQAEWAGQYQQALKYAEREKETTDCMREWQAATRNIPHKKLVALYKESSYAAGSDSGIDLFKMTLKAAASENFLSAFASMMGGSTASSSSGGRSTLDKRQYDELEPAGYSNVICHACGDPGHMIWNRFGAVVCPKELKRLAALGRGKAPK